MEFNFTFWVGLAGSLILVSGAAWPDKKTQSPLKSIKNWLFAVGGLVMLIYSILNYQAGGPIFFVFLEIFVNLASVFMMLNVPDKIDTPIIAIVGIGFIAWSLKLFEGYSMILFVAGLAGIGMGYASNMGTLRREVLLSSGSALIAVFSFLGASWIFFWLNIFFALFSGYYAVKMFFNPRKI